VGAAFDDATRSTTRNLIGAANRREAMRDDESSAPRIK